MIRPRVFSLVMLVILPEYAYSQDFIPLANLTDLCDEEGGIPPQCQDTYIYFGGKKCVKRYQQKTSYDAAKKTCKEDARILVELRTQDLGDKFEEFLDEQGWDKEEYWIGLKRRKSGFNYAWNDETEIARWTSFDMDVGMATVQGSCIFRRANRLWGRTICKAEKYFMCEDESGEYEPFAPELKVRYHRPPNVAFSGTILESRCWSRVGRRGRMTWVIQSATRKETLTNESPNVTIHEVWRPDKTGRCFPDMLSVLKFEINSKLEGMTIACMIFGNMTKCNGNDRLCKETDPITVEFLPKAPDLNVEYKGKVGVLSDTLGSAATCFGYVGTGGSMLLEIEREGGELESVPEDDERMVAFKKGEDETYGPTIELRFEFVVDRTFEGAKIRCTSTNELTTGSDSDVEEEEEEEKERDCAELPLCTMSETFSIIAPAALPIEGTLAPVVKERVVFTTIYTMKNIIWSVCLMLILFATGLFAGAMIGVKDPELDDSEAGGSMFEIDAMSQAGAMDDIPEDLDVEAGQEDDAELDDDFEPSDEEMSD